MLLQRPARSRDEKVRKGIMIGKSCSLTSGLRTVGNIQTNRQCVRNHYILGICGYMHSSFYTSGIGQKSTLLSHVQWHFKWWYVGIFFIFMGTLRKYLFHQLEFKCMGGHDKSMQECRTKVIKWHESWVTSNISSISLFVYDQGLSVDEFFSILATNFSMNHSSTSSPW